MARLRMVTRTINETVVTAMVVFVADAKVDYCEYRLAGTYTNEEALKYLKKNYESDEVKLVSVTNIQTEEKLYGMPESEFMALAKVLPPRTNTETE